MSSFLRFSLAAAAAALLFAKHADAAAFESAEVVCLDDMEEICTGFGFFTTPSPGEFCVDPADPATCETILEGGYTWGYTFIEGFEAGTDLSLEDPEEVTAAETGLEVMVTMDDDLSTCEITVGNETCASCSAVECTGFNVTYDCLNVDMGSMSMDCVPVEPIFYPLEIDDDSMGNMTSTEPGFPTNEPEDVEMEIPAPAPTAPAPEPTASASSLSL
ncbi:MAG: hypothetical protein SGARI_007544, partial [Bacillariaceae sp.]